MSTNVILVHPVDNLIGLVMLNIWQAKNYENLWEVHVRRAILVDIMDHWATTSGDQANVEMLLEALSVPGFMDIKLRVEKLLQRNI